MQTTTLPETFSIFELIDFTDVARRSWPVPTQRLSLVDQSRKFFYRTRQVERAQLNPEDPTSRVPYASVILAAAQPSLWGKGTSLQYPFVVR